MWEVKGGLDRDQFSVAPSLPVCSVVEGGSGSEEPLFTSFPRRKEYTEQPGKKGRLRRWRIVL